MICTNCSHKNTPEDIDYSNATNEEGEEYCIIELFCTKCNQKLYEGNQWGEFDREEALQNIKAKLHHIKKVNGMSFLKRQPPKLNKEDSERFIKRAKENEEKLKERVKKIIEKKPTK